MIYSMTAFATQHSQYPKGQMTVELKSVNNRFLDMHLHLPDKLRATEPYLRDLISRRISRGSIELRISLEPHKSTHAIDLDNELLNTLNRQHTKAKTIMADTQAPSLTELINLNAQKQAAKSDKNHKQWIKPCIAAVDTALDILILHRAREGQRLAETMSSYVRQIRQILQNIRPQLPAIREAYRQKLERQLREILEKVAPHGFEYIKGEELSARIASESALFGLRIDVAEELDRLASHQQELFTLLTIKNPEHLKKAAKTKNTQSLGKRLDFMIQEMNREINTLGIKSTSLEIKKAVIELKLLVEQLREQAQNIE